MRASGCYLEGGVDGILKEAFAAGEVRSIPRGTYAASAIRVTSRAADAAFLSDARSLLCLHTTSGALDGPFEASPSSAGVWGRRGMYVCT